MNVTLERAAFDRALQTLQENHGGDATGGYIGAVYEGFRDTKVDIVVRWTIEPPVITRVKLFRNDNSAALILKLALDERGDVTAGTALTRNDPTIFDQPLSEQFKRATDGCEPYQEVLPGPQLHELLEDLDILVPQAD